MKSNSVLSALVNAIVARDNCAKSANSEWLAKWESQIAQLMELLPHGSGFDSGTKLDESKTAPRSRVVFTTAFHHMNDGGYYDGWTQHSVTVKPSLLHGFTLSISGRNRNEIKDYIGEVFESVLSSDAPPAPWAKAESPASVATLPE